MGQAKSLPLSLLDRQVDCLVTSFVDIQFTEKQCQYHFLADSYLRSIARTSKEVTVESMTEIAWVLCPDMMFNLERCTVVTNEAARASCLAHVKSVAALTTRMVSELTSKSS